MPDIHRDHRVGAALAQHLGESAGGRAHVEREPPCDVDAERVEPGDELVRRPADVVVDAATSSSRRRRPAVDALTTGRPSTVTRPSAMSVRRVRARARKAARRTARRRGACVIGCAAMPAGPGLEAARERVVKCVVGLGAGRERLCLDHLERREQVVRLVVRRRGLDPCPQDTSRATRIAPIAQGRWNGSAYSRSGTRKP